MITNTYWSHTLGKIEPHYTVDALITILEDFSWKEEETSSDAATLIILNCSSLCSLNTQEISDFDNFIVSLNKKLIIVESQSIKTNNVEKKTNYRISGNTFLINHPDVDVKVLLDWLYCTRDTVITYEPIKPGKCNALIKNCTGSNLEDIKLPKNEKLVLKQLLDSKNIFEYFTLLVEFTFKSAYQEHISNKSHIQNIFNDDKDKEKEKEKEKEFLRIQRVQRFRQICNDIKDSLACRMMPNMLKKADKKTILIIDDNPDEYIEELQEIVDVFLPDIEMKIWKLDAEASQNREFLKNYCTARINKNQLIETLKDIKLSSSPENSEEPTTLHDLLTSNSLQFVLVDQLYNEGEGQSNFLGSSIIRSMNKIISDVASGNHKVKHLAKIIALSRSTQPKLIQQVLQAGAWVYISKSRLLSLPKILASIQYTKSQLQKMPHRNFRSLYLLPNETIGLLQTVKVPRISFHRDDRDEKKSTHTKQFEINPNSYKMAELLRLIPKPDLHVHLGSCMSTEFLVVASLIGLMKHSFDKQFYNEVILIVKTIHEIRKDVKKHDFCSDLTSLCEPESKYKNKDDKNKDDKNWIKNLAKKSRGLLKFLMDNTQNRKYEIFRAHIHNTLGISDYLSISKANSKIESLPDIKLAFFSLLHSTELNRDCLSHRWGMDDLIKIYLLTLCRTEGAVYKAHIYYNKDENEIDLLSMFDIKETSNLNFEAYEACWESAHKMLYSSDTENTKSNNTIAKFSKSGWQWNKEFEFNFCLEWETSDKVNSFGNLYPDFQKNPIEYELATGLRSKNLMDYLQGCEFSGAEHMRHPLLIHLYARQAVQRFINDGVSYAELRCSPDGFVDSELGFTFPDVCRCLVEAFTQAQNEVLDVYQSVNIKKGELSESKQSPKVWRLAQILGNNFSEQKLQERLICKIDISPDNQTATFSDQINKISVLPCKVSLILTGKRHKSTQEMLLEAAAVTVMRPSGLQSPTNVRKFVDECLPKCEIVGFDLAGAEFDHPPKLFSETFSRLSKLNIPITVHAGENAPPAFIEDAILLLRAKRIGHGIALVENKNLLARVREDKVCIELCPVGNHQTSNFNDPSNHFYTRPYPLKLLLEEGVLVTINTDNPIISFTNMVKEYFQASWAYDKDGLSLWDVLRIIRSGYVCSFLNHHEREAIMELVEQKLVSLFEKEEILSYLREQVSNQIESK